MKKIMREITSYGKFRFVNFGPFRETEIEIKPLTIFLGRNNTGKSFLLYTIWLILTAPVDDEYWNKLVEPYKYFSDIKKNLHNSKYVKEKLDELILRYLEYFPRALEKGLRKEIPRLFGVQPRSLVLRGEDKASIQISGLEEEIKININITKNNKIAVEYIGDYKNKFHTRLSKTKIKRIRDDKIGIDDELTGLEYVIYLRDIESFINSLTIISNEFLGDIVFTTLSRLYYQFFIPIFVDGRSGITRALLKPIRVSTMLENMLLKPDREYIDLYYFLISYLDFIGMFRESSTTRLKNLNLAKSLLEELGVKNIEIDTRAGIPIVKIRTNTGKIIPLTNTSSGIRETLLIVLLLSTRRVPCIFIEEPEAHLHPKAIRELARVLIRAINEGRVECVLLTTHSDYLIYSINNHLLKFKEKGEDIEALDHNLVSAYLFKNICEGSECYSVVEKLKVSEKGIDESEFVKIVEELADERAKYI